MFIISSLSLQLYIIQYYPAYHHRQHPQYYYRNIVGHFISAPINALSVAIIEFSTSIWPVNAHIKIVTFPGSFAGGFLFASRFLLQKKNPSLRNKLIVLLVKISTSFFVVALEKVYLFLANCCNTI